MVFHADQRFDLFLRGVVQPVRIGAAAVGGHGDADELMIVFAAHRVAGALDHAREGQKIVRVLHLFCQFSFWSRDRKKKKLLSLQMQGQELG